MERDRVAARVDEIGDPLAICTGHLLNHSTDDVCIKGRMQTSALVRTEVRVALDLTDGGWIGMIALRLGHAARNRVATTVEAFTCLCGLTHVLVIASGACVACAAAQAPANCTPDVRRRGKDDQQTPRGGGAYGRA